MNNTLLLFAGKLTSFLRVKLHFCARHISNLLPECKASRPEQCTARGRSRTFGRVLKQTEHWTLITLDQTPDTARYNGPPTTETNSQTDLADEG